MHLAIIVPNAPVRVHLAQVAAALGVQIGAPRTSPAATLTAGFTTAALYANVNAGPTLPHARPRFVPDYEMRET